jgi:hypothetical protein
VFYSLKCPVGVASPVNIGRVLTFSERSCWT